MTKQHTLLAALCLIVTGCSSISNMKIPSWSGSPAERSRTPANATEYQCAGGNRFYVRLVDNGASAWLIYPDREVALSKATGGATRYSNGVAILDITGAEATLNDGPGIAYIACKAVVAGK